MEVLPALHGCGDALLAALEVVRSVVLSDCRLITDSVESEAQLLAQLGITMADLNAIAAAAAAPRPAELSIEEAAQRTPEQVKADEAAKQAREFPDQVMAVTAASRQVPVLVTQTSVDEHGAVCAHASLYTGGSVLPTCNPEGSCGRGDSGCRPGATPIAADGGCAAAPAVGGGGGGAPVQQQQQQHVVDASEVSYVTIWRGHAYSGVPVGGSISFLLPALEIVSQSACKELGMPFHMGLVPSEARRYLEEVSLPIYVNEGRVEALAPGPARGG